jgi:N6-L-threonylcarbamoyladenine synthase
MIILGIETSCDETAVAIVDDKKNILSHVINSQIAMHKEYGGVVPELAARSHVEVLDNLILDALKKANKKFEEIDAFAATSGPGLIGGVIVGMMAAKTLSSIYKKPFLAINHLEAHALTARLTSDLNFPYLLLLLSGGHCQIIIAEEIGVYKKIGGTIDDALGEAFDKVALMLGLPYPGGPAVEREALNGNEKAFRFSRPLIDAKNKEHLFDFSFAGLKTAVRREIEKITGEEFSHLTSPQKINPQVRADICASFQKTVVEILIDRLENVFDYNKNLSQIKNLVIAGGVASNRYIFNKLQIWANNYSLQIITPPLNLCTDNAAMVAWVGVEKLKLGLIDNLNFKPRSKWEL